MSDVILTATPTLVKRYVVYPDQEIADKHTLVAQSYVGYFNGKDTHAAQWPHPSLDVVTGKAWKVPVVLRDECQFCARLTDQSAIDRVAGYQHQIDIECLRGCGAYSEWCQEGRDEVVDFNANSDGSRTGAHASAANKRRFCELYPDRLAVVPLNMTKLPLKLKRRLCIEWNHVYRDWMSENPDVQYDFDTKTFYKELTLEQYQAHIEREQASGYYGMWAMAMGIAMAQHRAAQAVGQPGPQLPPDFDVVEGIGGL